MQATQQPLDIRTQLCSDRTKFKILPGTPVSTRSVTLTGPQKSLARTSYLHRGWESFTGEPMSSLRPVLIRSTKDSCTAAVTPG